MIPGMGWWGAAVQVARDALGMPRPLTLELPDVEHTFDTAPRPVDRVISDMLRSAGGPISRGEAISVAAVQRGRNEMCAIATIPLRLFRGLSVEQAPLLDQLDPNVANVVTLSNTIEDLIFEGEAWWEITAQYANGYPMAVRHVPHALVSKDPPKNVARPYSPGPGVWIDGVFVGIDRMIKFDSPNPGLLRANARAVRRALALDKLAAMYADNPTPLELLTDNPDVPDAEPMPDDQIDSLLAEYRAMRRLSPVAWLPGNVKRLDVNQPSPADMQLVELQRQVTLEIANGLGVDPEDLGVSTTSRTYANIVDRRTDKINRVYAPIMAAITQRLSMGDVTPHGWRVDFDLTEYLRADPLTQAQYWTSLHAMGAITPQEVRNMAKIPGRAPTVEPAPVSRETSPAAALPPAGSTFGTGAQFTLAAPLRTFAVETETRTITGTAVPYGVVGRKYGIGYRFAPGSLEWSDAKRVKHLKDHYAPVGFASAIESEDAGLQVKLTVLDGVEGSQEKRERDQLLFDAAAGLYDGLSIGVDFSLDPDVGDATYDADDDVYDVHRATLREVSTTAMPVFDDARVSGVAASHTGGTVPCRHCQKPHPEGMACATYAAHQRNLAAAQPTPPTPPPPAPDPAPEPAPDPVPAQFGRTVVNPLGQPARVTEPEPYVFDRQGNLRAGSHDFSTDLHAGWREGGGGDQAARDRAQGFLQRQFAVTPANVAAINPNRNRPDLYVDQMEYDYPIWESINKGTLTDVTPFVVPKFATATGLVADHVTGTEPTPGAFTATAQTITPTAVSGKVEITRDAWDQGGNPQMSGLIWRQMTRGYYEALEAYAVAQLAAVAASIPDITITALAVDAALDQALSAAIVPLQYIRGGNRFRRVFTQIDLYRAMAQAKDSSGRRLYPMLGPQNANGVTEGAYSAIDAHGMRWLPAWALAATGTVAASSYAFDPEKVCAWASAPQRLDITWRVAWVDLGIWGYKAFAVTDFAGTRELIYDPA